jgi:thiamine-phosphate pyrophosphorylase
VPRELPRLIVITDWRMPRALLLERVEAALALGPMVALQHRHPEAPIRPFLDEAKWLAELCHKRQNPLFINGRLDVALLLGADLHLPSGGLLPPDVRPHLPKGAWISISVHNVKEASAAQGADVALISPVFPAGSKVSDERPPLGAEGFAQLAEKVDCAPFALGGITAERAATLRGAAGYAAVSAVLQSPDPRGAAAEILKIASST